MSIAWPSPVILKLQNGTDTPFSRPITNEESSWTVSGGYLLSITSKLFCYKNISNNTLIKLNRDMYILFIFSFNYN